MNVGGAAQQDKVTLQPGSISVPFSYCCASTPAFTSLVSTALTRLNGGKPHSCIPVKQLNIYIPIFILICLVAVLGIFRLMKILNIHLFIPNVLLCFSQNVKINAVPGMEVKAFKQP